MCVKGTALSLWTAIVDHWKEQQRSSSSVVSSFIAASADLRLVKGEVVSRAVLYLSRLQDLVVLIIASPAGAVAKYCDEYVCLCVCLSVREDISGTTSAIFTIFCACVARSFSGTLTIGRITNGREGGDGSAERERSVTYDCLVITLSGV